MIVRTKPSLRGLRDVAMSIFLFGCSDICGAVDAPGVEWPDPSKSAMISGVFRDSMIVLRATSRDAGAIDGLVWRGKQFINSEDHGRELQAAAAFSNRHRECFNPTEAGSAKDGLGGSSTSRLLSLKVEPHRLTTATQLAFWLDPSDPKHCADSSAPKEGPLSHDVYRKVVTIGVLGHENLIEFRSSFEIGDSRILGGFEAPTGYMPAEFSSFWIFDPRDQKLEPESGDIAYQPKPIILSTTDKKYALGVYAPPGQGAQIGYGAQRFTGPKMASPTLKWNVFFIQNKVDPGPHDFTSYVIIGSLDDVSETLKTLTASASGSQ